MSDRCDSEPVVVLYIGGDGRSGSTMLAALLGNHEGFFPIGEFRKVWRALTNDELCGCGESFSRCEFWRRVGERAVRWLGSNSCWCPGFSRPSLRAPSAPALGDCRLMERRSE